MARRDPAALVDALSRWWGAPVSELAKPSGAGLSNETWFFQAGGDSYVLQIGPAQGSGLFRDYDLVAMARVQAELGRGSNVPVAPVVRWEEDPRWLGGPFYVMQRVTGAVPSDNPPWHASGWFAELPGESQRHVWLSGIDALAALHAVDASRPDFQFLEKAPWGMPLHVDAGARRIAQWREFLAWGAKAPLPVVSEALAALERTRPQSAGRLSIAWGDAKLSNCVVRDGAVVALLDWELCGISDPEEDLAFWLLLDWSHCAATGVTRLPALPGARETVAHYESRTGARTRDVAWWFRFGLVRLAIIYHRFLVRRQSLGRLAADADLAAENPMCRLIPQVFSHGGLP